MLNRKFKVGDRIQGKGEVDNLDINGCIGNVVDVILDEYSKNKIGVQFDTLLTQPAHDCNGKGRLGYCWYVSSAKLTLIDKTEKHNKHIGVKNKMYNLIKRLIDKDTALMMDTVMNGDGNLNMNDSRVQQALMQTDGFRNNLIEILKAEVKEQEGKVKKS